MFYEQGIPRVVVASGDHWAAGEQVPEPSRRACRFEGDSIDLSQAVEVVVPETDEAV